MDDLTTEPEPTISPKTFGLPRFSIRTVLIVPFVLIVAATVGLTGWFSIRYGQNAVNEVASHFRTEVAERISERIKSYLADPPLVNELNKNALITGRLDLDEPKSWQPYFWRQIQAFPNITMSFIGTPDGRFRGIRRLANGELQLVKRDETTQGHSNYFSIDDRGLAIEVKDVFKNFDPRVRPWYKAAVEKHGPAWSVIYRHFVIPDLAITAAWPVYDAPGNLLGVFAVDYILSGIHQFLQGLKISPNGITFLLERSGEMISTSTSDPPYLVVDNQMKRVKAAENPNPVIAQAVREVEKQFSSLAGLQGDYRTEFTLNGQRQFVQVTRLKEKYGLNWLIVVVVPEADFMGQIEANTRLTIILMLAALLLSVLAGGLTSSWIVRPILQLNRTAKALAQGDWTQESRIKRLDEVGQLARSFNHMARQLREAFESLEAQNALITEHNLTLEQRVAERTTELIGINEKLNREIEERQKTSEALAQAHDKLRAIFDGFPGLIHVLDRDYNVVDASDKLLQARNFTRELVLGRKCYEVFRGFSEICPGCIVPESQLKGEMVSRVSFPEEEALLGMVFKAYSAPIRDSSSQVWGHVECIMDISDLRRMETELKKAKEAAEAASQAKSQFLANMSHEIRTPMAGMLGMSDLLAVSPLTDEQKLYVEMIQESGRQLMHIINDILDFSRIEAGRLELVAVDFSLHDTVDSVIRLFNGMAMDKDLGLEQQIDSEVPDRLIGDPVRIRQILVNLVGNAIKFTDAGQVAISIKPEASPGSMTGPSNSANLHFTVSDTGCGIPDDKLGVIFDSFVQADGSFARKFQGSGLGLAISKRLVEMMGGSIWVESLEGQGSRFHFTVFFRPGSSAAPEKRPDSSLPIITLRSLKILVAEDNKVNQILIERILTKRGHRVLLVNNGRQAIEELHRDIFDCVLMDIQMPEMDGLETTRAIRQSSELGAKSQVPIIALTAHALKGDRERFLEGGMNGYTVKPINIDELIKVIAEVLGPGHFA